MNETTTTVKTQYDNLSLDITLTRQPRRQTDGITIQPRIHHGRLVDQPRLPDYTPQNAKHTISSYLHDTLRAQSHAIAEVSLQRLRPRQPAQPWLPAQAAKTIRQRIKDDQRGISALAQTHTYLSNAGYTPAMWDETNDQTVITYAATTPSDETTSRLDEITSLSIAHDNPASQRLPDRL